MTRYALVIGITQYDGSLGNLTKPAHDAEAVAKVLEESDDFQEVKRLPSRWNQERKCYEVGEKPLKGEDLGQTLQKFIFEQAEGKDAVIYFSGHGFTVSDNLGKKKGYLATSDCKRNTIATCGIALDSLNQLIAESQLSSLVVLLDCCHAGSLLESNLVRQTLTAFNSQKDYYLIAACRAFESAWEGEKYSVFTEALLKGLTPDNAGSDGQVSCDRVFDFIATQLKGSGQEPIRMGWGRAITLVKYPPKTKTVVVDETCPYQGLQAFTKEQARFFFGRDKVVHLLIEKLAQGNFIPIIGASGSGKSSVVRAGLIPELEKNGWRVLEPIKPDVEPLAELRTAFKPYFSQSKELYEFIHHHPDGLNAIMERLPGNERFLLVVDQFEEVFTLCPKEDDKRRFIQLLTGCRGKALSCPYPRLSIVITLRADFIEPCLQDESLTQLIQDEAVYMPPLVGADLEKAITNPAHNQGYQFEDGLLGEIIQDVGKEQGSLPLLQFTLTELWERDKNHQLTREQYHQLGGVTGALNRHADKIYNYKDFKLDNPQQEREHQEQELIQRIFLKLVRTGEGDKDTRQRQAKAKLLDIGDDKVISDVLDELIQGRLLVAGQEKEHQEAWVDLAHEALMEGWERFVAWRQENRELRRLIDRVEDALKEWQKRDREKEKYLMMGGLLAEVRENWQKLEPDLSDSAKDFYSQSDAHEKEQIAALQQALNEAILREKAARVQNLLPVKPLDGLVLAIESIGLNQEKLPGEMLSSVQDSLHRAMETAREQNILTGHQDYVYCVAISPDGQYIVTGSRDNTLRLWDTKGNLIKPIQGHKDSVQSVAFSPDGEYIVSGSKDKTARLWNREGNIICELKHHKLVRSVAFSPDGQYIVTGSDDNKVRLWDTKGNLIGEPFSGHKGAVWSVAFSPDGKYIVSSSTDKTVRLWDIQDKPSSQTFQGHEETVTSVAFSPDGKYIVSGSKDETLRLWDIQGKPIGKPFRGHESDVLSVAFSPDGKYIVSGSKDETLRLWDIQGKPIGQPFRGHESEVFSVAISADGRMIVSGSKDKTARLWDTQGTAIGQPFQGHENCVYSVAISPNGQYIASGSGDNTVRLWDTQGNAIGQPFTGHNAPVVSVTFSPDGQYIASGSGENSNGSGDKSVRLWDIQGNAIGQPFTGHHLSVLSVTFSLNGQMIASGSADQTVRLWDITGQPIGQPFCGHTNIVRSVAFSPDGKYIVSGSDDKTVRLWDTTAKSIGKLFTEHQAPVKSVAFSPDSKYIVSGSDDKTVRLWDTKGNPIGQPFRGHEDSVKSVAFSPDGQMIISGSKDNTVRLWDTTGNPIGQPFRGHESGVYSVAFSPDGQMIVSSSDDKTVRLWRGSWQAWLQVCCDRLRHHPVFKNPQKDEEKAACETCGKYVWNT